MTLHEIKLTWGDALKLGPTKLSKILGCPTSTAGSWNDQSPSEWVRPYFLRAIEEYLMTHPEESQQSKKKTRKDPS